MTSINYPQTRTNYCSIGAVSLLILLISFGISANVQAQTTQWVQQAGTGGISNGVSSDAAGNCYATGMVSNPALFENISIPCHASDVFLAKYDASGAILWAKVAGGELLDQGNEVATDAAGNSYVTGAIQTNGIFPTVTFGNITLTGHGDYDWFLAKYDENGNVLWAKSAGSTQGDIANSVTIDASGNIYVCGFFSSTMTVDGVTVTSSGLFDVFIAKYDASGTLLWLKRAGGTGSDIANGIVSDAAGNVAICGEFQNTASFGSNSVTASGLGDAFIAKYNSAGTNLWVKKGGGNVSFNEDRAQSVAADGSGNFYITGDFTGTGIFSNQSVTSNNPDYADIFVAKYNTNGAIQWLHHGGGVHTDKGYTVGVDQAGNSFVSGFADSGPGVVFDNIALPPFGNEYIFLAKYDPAGAVQYVKQYAAGNGQDIHVLNNGCLYFSGGASKGNGNEFDNVSLVYVDRGAFIGKFCEGITTTCEVPTNISALNITTSTAKVKWNTVAGAAGYLFQYRKQGANNWKTKSITTAFIKLKNLAASTTYEYHVATICTADTGSFSSIQTFTTAPLREGETLLTESTIAAYPNPSNGMFTLKMEGLGGISAIDVFDLNGRMVYHEAIDISEDVAERTISLPPAFKGIAYIRISNAGKVFSKTLMIE